MPETRFQTRVLVDYVARHRLVLGLPGLAILLALATPRSGRDAIQFGRYLLWILLGTWIVFVLPPLTTRFEAVQRFAQNLSAVVVMVATASLTLLSFLDVFDRLNADQRVPRWVMYVLDDFKFRVVGPMVVVALFAAVAVSFPRRRWPNRLHLIFVVAMLACACEVVAIPSQATLITLAPEGFLQGISVSTFAIIQGLGGLVWAWAALLVLARKQDLSAQLVAPAEKSPADKYVAAGSSVAVTALLIAFFGLNTCWGYANNLDRLIRVRAALATDLVAALIGRDKALTAQLNKPAVPGDRFNSKLENDFNSVKAAIPPNTHFSVGEAWQEDATITPKEEKGGCVLCSGPYGSIFDVRVKEYALSGAWNATPGMYFPFDLNTNHTLAAAATCTDTAGSTTDYGALYQACERAVLDRGVKFPFVEVEFPAQYVIAVTFLTIVGCLIVFSDRVHAVLTMPPSASIEPWILLDASRFGSRMLANGWVLALVASPWLLIATAVRIISLRVRMEGSVSSVAHDLTLTFFLLLALVVAAFLSESVLGGLIALRHVRRYQLLQPAAQADPFEKAD